VTLSNEDIPVSLEIQETTQPKGTSSKRSHRLKSKKLSLVDDLVPPPSPGSTATYEINRDEGEIPDESTRRKGGNQVQELDNQETELDADTLAVRSVDLTVEHDSSSSQLGFEVGRATLLRSEVSGLGQEVSVVRKKVKKASKEKTVGEEGGKDKTKKKKSKSKDKDAEKTSSKVCYFFLLRFLTDLKNACHLVKEEVFIE
jgi:hypothetical protein